MQSCVLQTVYYSYVDIYCTYAVLAECGNETTE
jgi:hypothetical protein